MATFKEIGFNDIKTSRSSLEQLIEIVEEDISSSVSRRMYEVFVTGGVNSSNPGVTSSLYHSIYDQDYSLQTANALFDMTLGLNPSGSQATGSEVGTNANGKRLYPSQSLMMREKGFIYRQYAKALLGGAEKIFVAPHASTTATDEIDAALFIHLKRLFHRDAIKAGSLTLLVDASGASEGVGGWVDGVPDVIEQGDGNKSTYTDNAADTNRLQSRGGRVGNIVSGSRDITSANTVGVCFYDQGVVVLDVEKAFSASQVFSGSLSAIDGVEAGTTGRTPFTGTLNHFMVSASIDECIDHFAATRFGKGTATRISFQNITHINSSLVFCNIRPSDFNYSSNPTYINTDNEIQVIESGQEDVQKSFTFISSVGLYDANNRLLAVAKLSRPVLKNSERNLTITVRLDY